MGLADEMKKKAEEIERGKQPRMSSEDKKSKYFLALLPKGEKKATKRIRILPAREGEDVFQVGWFHRIKIKGYDKGYEKAKLYDPGRNDNKPSPLSDVAKKLRSLGTEEGNKLAKEYEPSKFYIVRVIDRDNPEDGVKFWRFSHSYKGDGVFDKILAVVENKGNIDDPETGRDLIITLGLQSNGKLEWTGVVSIMNDDVSPLHEDKEVAESWINDPLTWRDIYEAKPIEYLEIVARGETPKWDSDSKKYVSSDDTSDSKSFGGNVSLETLNQPTSDNTATANVDPQVDEEPDEDLPF
jgi:hypothetical protein